MKSQIEWDAQHQEWIRLAQQGNTEAITQLVATYQQSVFNVCYRMLGERAEAEDAAQETLIKAITKLHTFNPERPFRPWVLRIASNECIDRIRRRRPSVSLDALGENGAWEWQPGKSPLPEVELLRREREAQVRSLLQHLSPLDRLLVSLFYWEGLSYAEIATVTNLTIPAIKSRLFRARRTMARHLNQEAAHA